MIKLNLLRRLDLNGIKFLSVTVFYFTQHATRGEECDSNLVWKLCVNTNILLPTFRYHKPNINKSKFRRNKKKKKLDIKKQTTWHWMETEYHNANDIKPRFLKEKERKTGDCINSFKWQQSERTLYLIQQTAEAYAVVKRLFDTNFTKQATKMSNVMEL